MRIKNIKISIKSDKELFEEVKKVTGKLKRGETVKKHEGISFESLDWNVTISILSSNPHGPSIFCFSS